MKRRVCEVWLVVVVMLSLAQPVWAGEKIVAAHWSIGDPLKAALIQAAAKEGINLELTVIAPLADYLTKVVAMSISKTAPDVLNIDDAWADLGPFLAANVLAPLGRPEDVLRNLPIPQVLAKPFVQNGQLMAVPTGTKMVGMFVNLSLLQQAGLTRPGWDWDWNDYQNMARRLTRDDNGDGTPEMWGTSIDPQENYSAGFAWSNGCTYISDDLRNVTLDSPACVAAFSFLRQMVHESRTAWLGDGYTPWLQGKVAMVPGGSWNLSDAMAKAKYDWDFIPYPKSPNTGYRAALMGIGAYGVSTSTKYYDEALRYVMLNNTREVQEIRLALGVLPVRLDVMNSNLFFPPSQTPQTARQTIIDAFTSAYSRTPTRYPDLKMKSIADAAISKIIRTGASPQVTLTEAVEEMRGYLK